LTLRQIPVVREGVSALLVPQLDGKGRAQIIDVDLTPFSAVVLAGIQEDGGGSDREGFEQPTHVRTARVHGGCVVPIEYDPRVPALPVTHRRIILGVECEEGSLEEGDEMVCKEALVT
jgi:hypothetical protein